ncbi:MAG: replication-associated recombination protein A [Lactimicrobium sp.]|jgi:putative ATPase|uniref:replication-associated recombination protein A n=1 Tax=Lactimicrobium sp. TaxID=2563780 RepID=UPI002F35F391
MDLFEAAGSDDARTQQPLAARMRPEKLEEVVGQQHIIGKGRILYRAIQADRLSSLIFYGPPGTGKTTLAEVIANTTSASFAQVNATTAGKKDLETVVQQAQYRLKAENKKTILFIDEIHRFNKAQQDYLLPFVESGTIILIGATTENPYFEVNSALLSRSTVLELKPLSKEDLLTLIHRALQDPFKGVAADMVQMDEDACDFLAEAADGDARAALNGLEIAVLTTERSDDGYLHITLPIIQECIQKKSIRYDKDGDNHYDTVSAFIKSMRGSDPDAALYYLARMLEAGEDVRFIARRIMICAAEDVGLADPRAIEIATSCALAVERVGMPEGQIILGEAAVYVATAPKSNAASQGIFKAMETVKKTGNLKIPPYLQDAHYKAAEKLNRGIGYKYAHDYPRHYVNQQYLPDALKNEGFYYISDIGYESRLRKWSAYIGRLFHKEEDLKK